jgi:hypothetical protein
MDPDAGRPDDGQPAAPAATTSRRARRRRTRSAAAAAARNIPNVANESKPAPAPTPTPATVRAKEPAKGQPGGGGRPASRVESGEPGRGGGRDRGLRELVGAGPSQVGLSKALRARDVNRPTDQDVADAERELVIVRRNWKPRS